MTTKIVFTALALCACAFANAGIVQTFDDSGFHNPTVEHFVTTPETAAAYDFGNGMTYTNLDGKPDWLQFSGQYSLGPDNAANGGLNDDAFFATKIDPGAPDGKTSTSFEFKFAGGVTRFGFHGGAASGTGGPLAQDGVIGLEFYDMGGTLIDSSFADDMGLFSWTDFYGFESDATIGRVVFRNVGNMVLDDVTFEQAAAATVPEPASIALLGLGLAGFAVARRKGARR